MRKTTTAVIGSGYLGKFHAQKYAQIEEAELIAVVDPDPARAAEVAERNGTRGLTDYRELLGQVDAVTIAAPTTLHHRIALDFLNHGSHVLVEKPITVTVAEADELIAAARAGQRVLQVGHLERFNAALMSIHEHLTQPTFIESGRLAPFNPRGADVNVILDLMIHDIDIILDVVRADVKSIAASGTSVLSDAIDIANARIEFENGCVANVTASRVSMKSERKMRFFQQQKCFSVDFQNRALRVYRKGEKEMFPGIPEIVSDETRFEDGDAIMAETRAFVKAIRSGEPPLVSGEDGRRALETAIRISELLGAGSQSDTGTV